jgi:glycosyltransferase involved in cell wall biosynthesis
MRVCIDARGLKTRVTGRGRYELELVRALAEIDSKNEYVVLLNNGYQGTVVEQANFIETRIPGRQTSPGSLLFGARRVAEVGADIFHSLHQYLPRGIAGRTVVTLHDLFRIEHPELIHSGWAKRIYTRGVQVRDLMAIPYALRRADHVISVSGYSAVRAQERFGIDPARMSVIHHGVNGRFALAAEAGLAVSDDASPPFFLMVGDSTRHKNVGRVIGAMALLADKLPDVRLRVIGNGAEYARLGREARRLGVNDRVELLSQVPDDELIASMLGAEALVFPSLLEGFGMPIIEAQAAGCPVIASNCGAPAEVAGDAALLVDPLDTADIAAAMERMHADRALRDSMRSMGRARTEAFTWRAAAEKTIAVYEKCMSAPQGR